MKLKEMLKNRKPDDIGFDLALITLIPFVGFIALIILSLSGVI